MAARDRTASPQLLVVTPPEGAVPASSTPTLVRSGESASARRNMAHLGSPGARGTDRRAGSTALRPCAAPTTAAGPRAAAVGAARRVGGPKRGAGGGRGGGGAVAGAEDRTRCAGPAPVRYWRGGGAAALQHVGGAAGARGRGNRTGRDCPRAGGIRPAHASGPDRRRSTGGGALAGAAGIAVWRHQRRDLAAAGG
jgi:hypothetical protein